MADPIYVLDLADGREFLPPPRSSRPFDGAFLVSGDVRDHYATLARCVTQCGLVMVMLP